MILISRQIAAKYGEATAADAVSRSSIHMGGADDASPFAGSIRASSSYGDPYAAQDQQNAYGQPQVVARGRNDSFTAPGAYGGGSPLVQSTSRAGSIGTTHSTGWNSQAGTAVGGQAGAVAYNSGGVNLAPPIPSGPLYDRRGSQGAGEGGMGGTRTRVQSGLVPQEERNRNVETQYSQYSTYSEAEQYRDSTSRAI